MNYDKISEVQKELLKEYSGLKPTIGITKLKIMKEKGGTFELKQGESLEDFCLRVTVREPSENGLILPSEYKGVRVFYGGVTPEIIPAMAPFVSSDNAWFSENRG